MIISNHKFTQLKFMKEFFYTRLNEIVQIIAHLKKQKMNISLEPNRIRFFLAVEFQWLC